jgi:ankyrin repeat protein
MSFSRLPPELLLNIADHITDSEGKCRYADLNSLVQANRTYYICLNTILWKQALESTCKTELIFLSLIHGRNTIRLSRLELFLELGANIESRLLKDGNRFFSTPLFVAVAKDNVPMARLLLEKGASLRNPPMSISPKPHARAIMHAARSADMVHLLLNHGARLEEPNEFRLRPLMAYTERNDIAAMRAVLQRGAWVNAALFLDTGPTGMAVTALHLAVKRNVDAVKLLVEFGADLKRKYEYSSTVWHLAAAVGNTDVLRLLMKLWPEGIRELNYPGDTPLHVAAEEGKADAVSLLVEFWPDGIRAAEQQLYKNTPLHNAAAKGGTDVVRLLMELWPEGVPMKNRYGNTPLHLAAEAGNIDAVRLLVEDWPEGKEELNEDQETPLRVFLERFIGCSEREAEVSVSGRHIQCLWLLI